MVKGKISNTGPKTQQLRYKNEHREVRKGTHLC